MKTLLMLGDSLVEWGDWQKHMPSINVINRGMAGEATEGLAARLIGELNSVEEPDAILIQSGTNNLLMGYPHFPAIHSTMVPTIRAFFQNAPIIINSLMPMPIVPANDLADINEELKDITQSNENCFFLDMVPPFTEKCLPITQPGFLNDQVHLSTRGYIIWAEEIQRFIESLFS